MNEPTNTTIATASQPPRFNIVASNLKRADARGTLFDVDLHLIDVDMRLFHCTWRRDSQYLET